MQARACTCTDGDGLTAPHPGTRMVAASPGQRPGLGELDDGRRGLAQVPRRHALHPSAHDTSAHESEMVCIDAQMASGDVPLEYSGPPMSCRTRATAGVEASRTWPPATAVDACHGPSYV
jgi:hypothetical protein